MTSRLTFASPRFRLVISVLVIGHLMALVLPPLAFQARGQAGQSPSVSALLTPVRHYAEAIHIDRGYAFFAPDPGPSHLIQAIIAPPEGSASEQMIPDLDQQWPRLLYHRHFMLAEFFTSLYEPPPPDPATGNSMARQRFLRLWESIHRHLETKYQASDGRRPVVTTRRIQHVVPNYSAYLDAPIQLDDPRLFRVLLDQPVNLQSSASGDQPLLAPVAPTETIPAPTAEMSSTPDEGDS